MAKNISQQATAERLKISRSNVFEILTKFQGTESVLVWSRYKWSPKLLHRLVQKLIRTAQSQPKKTARQVIDECNLSNLVLIDTTKNIFQ